MRKENNKINTAVAAGFPGFDEAYGNPPYKRSLHLTVLERTLSVCKEGGMLSAIHPMRWMEDPLAMRREKSDLKKFYDLFQACTSCEAISHTAASAIFDTTFEYDLGINVYEKSKNKSTVSQELLIPKEVRELISHIVTQDMLTIADICRNNTSEWDKYYRVEIRDIARGPSFSRYKRQSYEVARRIHKPGAKLIDKNAKYKNRKIVVFATYQECVNFINAYKTDIIVGYLQKVCVNRHNPIDFIPVFDGDFSKSWDNDDIIEYLRISTEDAQKLMWDDNYENPILSITGDKKTGIKCASKNCLAKESKNSLKKASGAYKSNVSTVKPGKKFSPTKYRKKKCNNLEELLELQKYLLSEMEPVLKLLPDELRALVIRCLQRKFNQQQIKFPNKPKEAESIDPVAAPDAIQGETIGIETDALENATTTLDEPAEQPQKSHDDGVICPTTNTRANRSVFYVVASRRMHIILRLPGIIKMVNRPARGPPLSP